MTRHPKTLSSSLPPPEDARARSTATRPCSPTSRGADPQTGAARRAVVLAVAATALVAACTSGDAQVDQPVVLGMTDKMAPFYQDEELTLYEAQIPVPLPVRRPTQQESSSLGAGTPPYSHGPFLLASDESIEVHFTLTNIDDKDHVVELLLDPWNEFVRYKPGVIVVSDEQTTPNLSGYDKLYIVPGKSRVTGTLTTDDMHELAVDLATVESILSKPLDPTDMNAAQEQAGLVNRAFNIQNRSNDGDPLITPLIPPVIAGLAGFDLGIRTTEPANVAVEIFVDVIDQNGNRFLPPGTPKNQILAVTTRMLSLAAAR